MTHGVVERYRALAAAGEIERDPGQENAVASLAALEARLASERLARRSTSLGRLFRKRDKCPRIKGVYLFGGVGRGKTMLMDLFFASVPADEKRRVHFHEFM